MNSTWWQWWDTLEIPETTAVSHQESPGLPSGVEENEINPKQPTQLPLPAKFSGANGPKQAECWMKWSSHFECYRVASGLKNEPEHEQVSTLLYSMGDCADDILATLHIDENKATYEEVCTALNLIVQRARFNKRQQLLGESVDAFIQDLYQLAEDCE